MPNPFHALVPPWSEWSSERAVVVAAGLGGDERGQVAFGETTIEGGLSEGHVDRFVAMQAGQGDGVSHLDLDAGGAGGSGFDQPQMGPVAQRQEGALGLVGGLGLALERSGWPGWVMRIVDLGVTRGRQRVAGHFSGSPAGQMGDDEFVAFDADPDHRVGQGVRHRVLHAAEADGG